MKCIINGKLVLRDSVKENFAVVFDKRIKKIANTNDINISEYEIIDAKGMYVCPGLCDIHIHGYMGADVSDGDADGIKVMAQGIIKNGVTAWCPTTMTVSKREIETAFDAVRKVKNSSGYYGARILGVNSEGPFINPSKKGAQAEEHILAPDPDFILANKDIVKLFTIAPEVCGALEAIEKIKKESNVLISMGHTNATFEQAKTGIDSGVSHTTHLFNAMTPLTHRSPGVVGAALSDDNVSVELIADTFHIDKGLFGLIAKIKKDNLCLITDCIRAGGMADGDYTLGGQPVRKEGIKCLMPDGTIAGSVLELNKAILNILENTNLEIYQAVNCASYNPAKVLGQDNEIGSIEVEKRADFMIADDKFNVAMTILDGEIRYKGE